MRWIAGQLGYKWKVISFHFKDTINRLQGMTRYKGSYNILGPYSDSLTLTDIALYSTYSAFLWMTEVTPVR